MERLKWPGITVLLALLAVVLRRWQMAAAFDEAGLVNAVHPSSIRLFAGIVFRKCKNRFIDGAGTKASAVGENEGSADSEFTARFGCGQGIKLRGCGISR